MCFEMFVTMVESRELGWFKYQPTSRPAGTLCGIDREGAKVMLNCCELRERKTELSRVLLSKVPNE